MSRYCHDVRPSIWLSVHGSIYLGRACIHCIVITAGALYREFKFTVGMFI